MNKLISTILALTFVLSLAACGSTADSTTPQTSAPTQSVSDPETSASTDAPAEAAPEAVTITTLNGSMEAVELEVPYDPERVAILDMASLDILDALGVGDRVAGSA